MKAEDGAHYLVRDGGQLTVMVFSAAWREWLMIGTDRRVKRPDQIVARLDLKRLGKTLKRDGQR